MCQAWVAEVHMFVNATWQKYAACRIHIFCSRIHHNILGQAVPAHDSGDFPVLDQDVAGEYLPLIYNSGIVDVKMVAAVHGTPTV